MGQKANYNPVAPRDMPVLWLMHGIVCMDLGKSWLTTRPFSPLPPAAAGLGRVDVRMASLIDCCGIKQKPFLGRTGGLPLSLTMLAKLQYKPVLSSCHCSLPPSLHSDSHFLHVPTASALLIHTSSTFQMKCFSSILGYRAYMPYAKTIQTLQHKNSHPGSEQRYYTHFPHGYAITTPVLLWMVDSDSLQAYV